MPGKSKNICCKSENVITTYNCNWFWVFCLFVDAATAVAAVYAVELFSIHIKRTAVDRVSLMQNSCSQQIEQNKCWRLDSGVHMWVCAVDVRQQHAYSTYVSTIATCEAKLKPIQTCTHWHTLSNSLQPATERHSSTCTRHWSWSSFSILRVIRTETHRTICCSFRIWPQTKAQIP